MHWYVVHTEYQDAKSIIHVLNKKQEITAFIPKMERWYSVKGHKDYVVKELYENEYIFMCTDYSIDYCKKLLNIHDIYQFDNDTSMIINHFFMNDGIIHHSVGNVKNKTLECISGPLMGYEDRVIRVDRHRRLAELNVSIIGKNLKVPVEVINKT